MNRICAYLGRRCYELLLGVPDRLGPVEDEVNPGVKCPPLAVLLLRHPVAPEKAEQRKKEALPSNNTSAANLCKTVKAPSLLLLLLLRPSCKEKEKSNNKHHGKKTLRRLLSRSESFSSR